MQITIFGCHFACLLRYVLIGPLLVGATLTAAQTERVIHRFTGTDGAAIFAPVIADGTGNLYGVAANGGAFGQGTVFRLSPPATTGGMWTETTLYNFTGSNGDGAHPQGGLVMDAAGNLSARQSSEETQRTERAPSLSCRRPLPRAVRGQKPFSIRSSR